jgi:hypothetical protein
MARFYEACHDAASQGSRRLIANVRERMSRFVGATPQYDDMTLLAIHQTTRYSSEPS